MIFFLQIFTPLQETTLVQYIQKCADFYYGLTIKGLKKLAYEFALKLQVECPQGWHDNHSAGKKWYQKFMDRHKELSLRTPEHTSLHRVKGFCEENVNKFFDQLNDMLELKFDPSHIYNMDETGFPTVPTRTDKVITTKGTRRVGQVATAERGTSVSMALTVNAAGNSIPPMFLFPYKKMQSCFMDNATPGSIGFANGGWMTQEIFVKYMEHFLQHSHSTLDNPTLLLLDNHTSHMSIEALDLAAANGVHMLTFPPHCSHRMQPLDISVFYPVKNVYKSLVAAWHQNNVNKSFEVRHIVGIVKDVLDVALLPKTIKSGFQAAGIYPFHPHIFTESDFIAAKLTREAETVEIVDAENQLIDFVSKDKTSVSADKEICLSEPSTSTSVLALNLSEVLSEVGPLQEKAATKKSNRGRKPMQSCILTSPENIAALKDKKRKREEHDPKLPVRKAMKKAAENSKQPLPPEPTRKSLRKSKLPAKQESSEEDVDFCIICLKNMPSTLTKFNSIACNECKREVHLKCVKMRGSWYTCPQCNSDDSN